MPRYDFRCPSCDTTFEVVRPSSERQAPDCPACGADARRVFTPVGVVFKGSGFHSTDYAPGDRGSGPSDGADTPAPKSGGGKDSCPAAGSSDSCGSCPAVSDS